MGTNTQQVLKNFLVDSEDTGRHIVKSIRTGREYYVEPIGDGRMADWGSYNPSTGNIEHKKGAGKCAGSVREIESIVTKENGFDEVHFVDSGSPYEQINKLDEKYPDLIKQ